MTLRFVEDRRTLIWAFILFPGVPILGYARPELAPYLAPIVMYLAYTSGVLTHNHLHCPVFRSKRANEVYSAWLSFFYGCPVFTWIPTHNGNHHRFSNGEGDVTRTTRHSIENSLWAALSYPWRSAVWQSGSILDFVRRANRHRPQRFRQIVLQSSVVLGGHAALFVGACVHRGSLGALLYASLVGVPALFAPWFMMFTNYLQHVDCDPKSADDHSRNFVNPLWNWLVFDAGYHTVHHDQPGLHWSAIAEAHRARAHRIAPHLDASSPIAYCVTTYLAAPLSRLVVRDGLETASSPLGAARNRARNT